ncbi:hypothetical protein KST17_08170 [Fusobacterium canifelinum]|uniref:hypothetical protein n=1 Tax=Fusobacterium canifelinum TaxID=285729 RepID=UPI0030CE5A6E
MIKKILFFLFFSIISLAQQVELKSVEKVIINDEEKSTISISQNYDKKTRKLEVLYIEKGLNPYTSKTFIQYDKDEKKELSNEEYRYNPSTQKWEKDNKTVTTYKNNKEIVRTYDAKENKWNEYMKYENENTRNSHTSITYSFQNKKWLPLTKTYILLNKNKENTLIEDYTWNKNNKKWELEAKSVYTYNQDGKLKEIVGYKKENNWIANQKLKYYTDENGNKVYSNFLFEDGKWIEQDRTISEEDKLNNKKITVTQKLNQETKKLENYYHSIETYKNDMIEQELVYFWDKDKKDWKKSNEQNYFYNENKKLIRKQDFLGDDKGVQFTYNFDKNGNNIEILIEEFNFQLKTWEATEKIEYLYDLSITKDKVLNKRNIDDEEVNSVNPILEMKHYIYKNGNWIVTEQSKYSYSKK